MFFLCVFMPFSCVKCPYKTTTTNKEYDENMLNCFVNIFISVLVFLQSI